MSSAELMGRFRYTVSSGLSASYLDSEPEIKKALYGFITQGANRLEYELESLTSEDEKRQLIAEAEENLTALFSGVEFLYQTTDAATVDASIIERVKRRLCPLHPFC